MIAACLAGAILLACWYPVARNKDREELTQGIADS